MKVEDVNGLDLDTDARNFFYNALAEWKRECWPEGKAIGRALDDLEIYLKNREQKVING